MYIGYAKGAKFNYTRVGGKPLACEPVHNEDGSVEWKWDEFYNSSLEIRCTLARECYVGSVTLPLTERARIAGAKVYIGGRTVGKYSAGDGRVTGGNIIIPVGVNADSLIIRIENAGACVVGFFEPIIAVCEEDGEPLIWPTPKRKSFGEGTVKIAKINAGDGEDARYAAEFLRERIKERFGDIYSEDGITVTLMTSKSKMYASEHYTVSVSEECAELVGGSRLTLLYAVYAFLSLFENGGFRTASISSAPSKEYRGFHMGLPKVSNIPFARSLFRDILLPLGYNMIIFQIIGCLEFERHPEITEAWVRECKRQRALGKQFAHEYMGCEGETISKKDAKALIDYARELGFEVVPEIQSLGHVQWITTSHPEIAELAPEAKDVDNSTNEDARPDVTYHHCYCPSNEKSYELLFDIMDEILEVVRPERYVHIGHDEVYYMGLCEKCKDTPHDVLFARDVRRIYDHLKELGLRTMMWSDMIQPVTKYQTPGAIKMLPKDILMLDFIWYFHLGLDIEENLFPEGYEVIAGNLYSSHYPRYKKRMAAPEMHGGQVSTWCEVNEYRMAKKGKFWDLTYTAEMLWNVEKYDDNFRTVFSHVISKYIQPLQRDLVRGKYSINGYSSRSFELPAGKKCGILRELLEVYPNAIIADGASVKVAGKYDRLVIEHTALEIEKRVPWTELRLSGEYTVKYSDGTELIARAEYGGGVVHYDRRYGEPLPESVHRHTGYIGTWFADPVLEGKTDHGEDILVLGYIVENPYPEKEITEISYKASETDISNVVLCNICGLNKI